MLSYIRRLVYRMGFRPKPGAVLYSPSLHLILASSEAFKQAYEFFPQNDLYSWHDYLGLLSPRKAKRMDSKDVPMDPGHDLEVLMEVTGGRLTENKARAMGGLFAAQDHDDSGNLVLQLMSLQEVEGWLLLEIERVEAKLGMLTKKDSAILTKARLLLYALGRRPKPGSRFYSQTLELEERWRTGKP